LLYDSGHDVAKSLVTHPLVKAAAFTGSLAGGRALMSLASSRPEPIPFYAEMGSVNPVFILPGALNARGESIADGLHASVSLGVGQFCTNPGVLVTIGEDKRFSSRLAARMEESAVGVMLNAGISNSYQRGVSERAKNPKVVSRAVQQGASSRAGTGCQAAAALFETDAASWLADHSLHNEIFGPTTLLVQANGREEMLEIARKMEGNLTATIHGTEEDLRNFSELIAILETKVGRIIYNGFPTGLEVCQAIVHGGPYPATSDGRSTSVGGRAIARFARPVCYQDFPDSALPDELKTANPLGIWRMVNGKFER